MPSFKTILVMYVHLAKAPAPILLASVMLTVFIDEGKLDYVCGKVNPGFLDCLVYRFKGVWNLFHLKKIHHSRWTLYGMEVPENFRNVLCFFVRIIFEGNGMRVYTGNVMPDFFYIAVNEVFLWKCHLFPDDSAYLVHIFFTDVYNVDGIEIYSKIITWFFIFHIFH